MIDGFRYGFFGVSDVSPHLSLAIVGGSLLALSFAHLSLLNARLQASPLRKPLKMVTPEQVRSYIQDSLRAITSRWPATAIISRR